MKIIKGVYKTSCAPAIWKKLSNRQKIYWECLYKVFNDVNNLPILPNNMKYDYKTVEITAHNMACTAIWELDRLGIIEGNKKRITKTKKKT